MYPYRETRRKSSNIILAKKDYFCESLLDGF